VWFPVVQSETPAQSLSRLRSSPVQSGQSSQQSVSYPMTDPTAPELLAADSVPSTIQHSPDQQATVAAAAALSVTALVQSVRLRLDMLLGFPGFPGGTQLTSLLVELLRAEQQIVDSPVLVGQFLTATADLRASLADHIQNHPAMTPGGGGGDLFHLTRPTLGLVDRDRSSSYPGPRREAAPRLSPHGPRRAFTMHASCAGRGPRGDTVRTRQLEDEEWQRHSDCELCLACGEERHWKRECPNVGKGKGRRAAPA
jgi:hypothetical protein